MNKKICVTLLFAVSFLTAIAQNTQKISCGIMAGVSSGSVKISGVDNHIINYIQGDNIFGIETGFFSKFNINPFYVKPAALILYQSGAVDVFNGEGEAYSRSDFKMTRLEIPLLFGMNIIGPVNAEIGPVYNHMLSVTSQYNGYAVDVPENGFGYRAGVNVEMGMLTVGLSYQSITNRSGSQGTFESPNELTLGAALTFCSGHGMSPYGR